jgi:hypothetical protein
MTASIPTLTNACEYSSDARSISVWFFASIATFVAFTSPLPISYTSRVDRPTARAILCSAVALRLISGTAGLVGVPSAEAAYVVAAWSSWLLPLAAYEIVERACHQAARPTAP